MNTSSLSFWQKLIQFDSNISSAGRIFFKFKDCLCMFQDQSVVRPIFESCVWWLSSKSSDGHLWCETRFTGKVSLYVVVVWILSKTICFCCDTIFLAYLRHGAWSIIFYVHCRIVQRFHIQDLTGMLAVGFSHYSRGTLMIVSCLIWFGFHLC